MRYFLVLFLVDQIFSFTCVYNALSVYIPKVCFILSMHVRILPLFSWVQCWQMSVLCIFLHRQTIGWFLCAHFVSSSSRS